MGGWEWGLLTGAQMPSQITQIQSECSLTHTPSQAPGEDPAHCYSQVLVLPDELLNGGHLGNSIFVHESSELRQDPQWKAPPILPRRRN